MHCECAIIIIIIIIIKPSTLNSQPSIHPLPSFWPQKKTPRSHAPSIAIAWVALVSQDSSVVDPDQRPLLSGKWVTKTSPGIINSLAQIITLPETNSSPLKIDSWKRRFLLETTIFKVRTISFQGCIILKDMKSRQSQRGKDHLPTIDCQIAVFSPTSISRKNSGGRFPFLFTTIWVFLVKGFLRILAKGGR